MKRFSFVIPVYERKKLLNNALEALNFQNGYGKNDFEVIVVDDGSRDGLYTYIQGINRKYDLKYIYLERNDNSCRARTRNQGWKNASGEIIVFMDADILVKENYLKELDRYYSAYADFLMVGTRLMLPKEVSYESVCNQTVFDKYRFDGKRLELLEVRHIMFDEFSYNASAYRYPWMHVYSANIAVPRRWLEKAGGFDENFKGWGLEDLELGCNLYRNGIRIAFNSKMEGFHQFHAGSGEVAGKDRIKEMENNIRYFLKKHPGALGVAESEAFDLLMGTSRKPRDLEMCEPLPRHVVDFTDKEKLEELKKVIAGLAREKGIEIVVNDYVEDTDLDIWVQLLGRTDSSIRYYPVSKRLEVKQLMGERPG